MDKKISKKVRPILLTYTNGIFHPREYAFLDCDHYNSIQLVEQKKYTIKEETIVNIEVIKNLLKRVSLIQEPNVPFPQADYFSRIINLC